MAGTITSASYHTAGIVAIPSGMLTMTDCIYDGRLLTTNGTTLCGGFVGWHNNQTISITSSLYAPGTIALSDSPAETAITNGATFVRGGSAGNYCYYTEPWGEGMTSYSVNACSAYFQLLNGLTAGDAAADVRAFNLIFGDDEATGIISANPSGSMVNTSDAWYTISGMKLGTQPRQKGVYIYKGNKVVIK